MIPNASANRPLRSGGRRSSLTRQCKAIDMPMAKACGKPALQRRKASSVRADERKPCSQPSTSAAHYLCDAQRMCDAQILRAAGKWRQLTRRRARSRHLRYASCRVTRMMYLDRTPLLMETKVFSAMPDRFRRERVRSPWGDANRPGLATDCFIEG